MPPVLESLPCREGRSARWKWIWVWGTAVALGLWLVHAYAPAEYGFYPRCGLYAWTGLHCPGCGSLRAVHHLTHGRGWAALDSNALLVVGLALAGVWGLVRWWRGCPFAWGSSGIPPAGAVWLMVLLVAFTILRNLPWYPFAWLAP